MFCFAGIFRKDGFVVSLGGIYLDNSAESGTAGTMGLSGDGLPCQHRPGGMKLSDQMGDGGIFVCYIFL